LHLETARPVYAEVLATPILVSPVIPAHLRIVTPPFPTTRAVPPIAPLPTTPGFRSGRLFFFLGILSLSSLWLGLKLLPRSRLILGCPLLRLRYYALLLLWEGCKASAERQRPRYHKQQ
jgi:hypothetical protein